MSFLSAGYRIVIICSNEDDKSFFTSKFDSFKRSFVLQTTTEEFRGYLINHFTKQFQNSRKLSLDVTAATLAEDKVKYVLVLMIEQLQRLLHGKVLGHFVILENHFIDREAMRGLQFAHNMIH